MRFADRHVKLRRFIGRIGRRVLDDEAFCFRGSAAAGGSGPGRDREIFEAEKFSDAVLQVNDQVALLQIRKINVEGGARGQRMGRFQSARALNLVAAKNLGVGRDDQFQFVADEAARQRAEVNFEAILRGEPVFLPNFLEALALAVVVAENVEGEALPQPAMQLNEKFAPLRLGDLRVEGALGQRAECFERGKAQIGRVRRGDFRTAFGDTNGSDVAPEGICQNVIPGDEERIVSRNLRRIVFGAKRERFRLA